MCWEDTGSRPKVRLTAAQKMSIRQINSVVWESIRSDTEHIIVKLCNVSALSYLEMHNFPPLFPYFAHYPQVKSESVNRSVMSDCSQPHGLEPSRLLCPWNSPGKNPGVDCHFLLQGIFLTQGSNLGLLCCRHVLYHLSHQGKWLVTNKKTVQLPNHLLFTILRTYVIEPVDVCLKTRWYFKNLCVRDCRDSPGVKTMPSEAEGVGLIPGWGAKTPHTSQPKNQNIKQKQYCSQFSEDFKNDLHPRQIFEKKPMCENNYFKICILGLKLKMPSYKLQSKSKWAKLNSLRKTC